MAGHPQGSNRGVSAKPITYINSTTNNLQGNSTAVIVSAGLRVGSKTTYFTSNSTGVKLGTKYITGNSTGN